MKAVIFKAQGHDSLIAVSPNNPEFGIIPLRYEGTKLNDSGFLTQDKRVAGVRGRVKDLEDLIRKYNLKEGDDFSEKVTPVKLIVKESTQPFYEGQDAKINPTTGAVMTHNGEPIYRRVIVVPEGSAEKDEFLSNDQVSTTNAQPAKAAAIKTDFTR